MGKRLDEYTQEEINTILGRYLLLVLDDDKIDPNDRVMLNNIADDWYMLVDEQKRSG
nr:hypothetical protein [uncultured Mediterraneibacter sp.]